VAGANVNGEIARGLGHIVCSTGITGAAIGADDVVVDGLGDSDDLEFVACMFAKMADHEGGTLRSVATDEQGLVDLAPAQVVQDLRHLSFRRLYSRGAERSAGAATNPLDLRWSEKAQVNEIVADEALQSLSGAQDSSAGAVRLFRIEDCAEALIDDRCWPAGLDHEQVRSGHEDSNGTEKQEAADCFTKRAEGFCFLGFNRSAEFDIVAIDCHQ
jgi:hypothetical protein